ncbi:MAG: hypothetical protein ACP5IE_03735 [Infirmifilum sp.]
MKAGARVSFINTDISRVVFRNCDLTSPFDEKLLREKYVTLDNVLAVIRNLRENCDYYLR